jgi:hypothetical protein
MSYNYSTNIEVYMILNALFRTPLKEAPEGLQANYIEGDLVIIMDDNVWVKNRERDGDNNYSLAVYTPAFVRINPTLFKKVDNIDRL